MAWTIPSKPVTYLIVGCILTALTALGYAFFIEPGRLVVRRAEIVIEGLDPAFSGLKIVSIGDLHAGSNRVTPEMLARVVDLTNQENPDMVVLLGDYVSGERVEPGSLRMPMSAVADGLAGLRSRHGVFAVLGNHDAAYADDIVTRELERAGATVLDGKCVSIKLNEHNLRVLGLEDHLKIRSWQTFADKARNLLLTCGDGSVVALEHSPDVLPMLTGDMSISTDLKLILAAHTHGGQVWLPILGAPVIPSSYGQKYAAGHIKENGVDMFVTTGIGTSILPFRFLVPPEIAVITLTAK